MSKERDILKSLLLQEELEVLENLKNKLLSKKQFTDEVSRVLSGAIKRAKKQDKEFEKSLSGPIKRGVNKAFTENKQTIINSLLPIMGQLIRKTVTNSIKQFVADINRTLELGFSAKALKWRWDAMKSGEKFADIVFQNTIHYQITEMFVIHHENGLLIQHVGSDVGGVLKDNDALSAMLTVLQDFIGDSVQTTDSGLLSIEVSDKLFLISTGPQAYLASVIKGSPTERLKQKLQELIENIHSEYSNLISDQLQYQNNIEFTEYLSNNLVTKSLSDTTKPLNWKPWVISIVLMVMGLLYWTYKRNQQYQEVYALAQSVSGLYLNQIKRENGQFIISGLMDPLADKSTLQADNIRLDTIPFLSLDEAIVQKRVDNILINYPNIKASVSNNTVIISGEMKDHQSGLLIDKLNYVSGIDEVINQLSIDYSQRIRDFFLNKTDINQTLNYNLTNKLLTLEGAIKQNIYHSFISELRATFPDTEINDDNIVFVETIDKLVEDINNAKINLPGLYSQNNEEKQKLLTITQNITDLFKFKGHQKITIIGESDCVGKNSDEYSLKRAEFIKQALIKNNIDKNSLTTNIKPCVIFHNLVNNNHKNVSFMIQTQLQ